MTSKIKEILGNKNLNNTMKERDYLFDNFRALLIFSVVLGHMLTKQLGNNLIIDTVYNFIYFFHMPAFIFIAGYFSKNVNKCRDTAVVGFFIPYVILSLLFYAKDKLIEGEAAIRVISPVWGLWFLLTMFIWKVMLKDIVRIRFILPLSFLVGVLTGFSSEFSTNMSLSRLLTFLPFFILGYFFNDTYINKIRKIPRIIAYVATVGFVFFAYLCDKYDIIKKEQMYMRRPYIRINEGMLDNITARIVIYIVAIILTLCFINIMSRRKTLFSVIGQNTITVYIFHLFIVEDLRLIEIPWSDTPYYLIYAIIVAAILTYLFSRPSVTKTYKTCIDKVTSLFIRPL